MPTRPAIANVIKHQMMIVSGGEYRVTTIRVLHAGAITDAMRDADRAALKTWANNFWRDRSLTESRIVRLKAWDLSTAVPTKLADDPMYLAPIVGTMALGQRVPRQLCFCASYRTGAVGDFPKPPSARIYHAGGHIGSEMTAAGTISNTETAALGACYDALRTAFTGVGSLGTLVLVSYWLGGTRAAPVLRDPPVALPITRTLWTSEFRTQRRHAIRQASYATN